MTTSAERLPLSDRSWFSGLKSSPFLTASWTPRLSDYGKGKPELLLVPVFLSKMGTWKTKRAKCSTKKWENLFSEGEYYFHVFNMQKPGTASLICTRCLAHKGSGHFSLQILFYSISFKSVNTGINKNLAQLILALTRIFSHNSPPQTLSPCSDSLWTKSPESFCTLETPTRLFTGLFEKGQRSEKAIAYDITIYKSSRSHSTSYCFFWTEHYSVLKGVSSKFV